jgi:hypothetical protein
MEKEIYSFVSYNLFLSCNALCYDVFFINIYYIIFYIKVWSVIYIYIYIYIAIAGINFYVVFYFFILYFPWF